MERLVEAFKHIGDDPWIIAMVAFFGASFAGLATQLRNGKVLTTRSIAAAMLNSGFIGMIIFLMGFQMFTDNIHYLIGLCLLAGIGGSTMLDFFITFLKKNRGVIITIKRGE